MDFADKWAAIVWMCRNQLGRRNITDEQKTALIGEAYKAQKLTQGNHAERGPDGKYLSAHNEHLGNQRTSEVVAKGFGVGRETVKRAEHFVDGLNEAEKVSPGIKESILSGEVKAPKSMIAEIRAQRMSVGNHAEKKRDESGKFSVSHQSGVIWEAQSTEDVTAKQFGVGSYNAVAKLHGVSRQTVKSVVTDDAEIGQLLQQKKEQNTAKDRVASGFCQENR